MFTHSIAQVEQHRVQTVISDSPFLAILFDGSTDKSIVEVETVYVRDAKTGNATTHFASLAAVEKADAAGMFAATNNAMHCPGGWTGWLEEETCSCRYRWSIRECWKHEWRGQAIAWWNPSLSGSALHGTPSWAGHGRCYKESSSSENCQPVIAHTVPVLQWKLTQQSEPEEKLWQHEPTISGSNHSGGGTRWVSYTLKALGHVIRGYPAILQHLQQVINLQLIIVLCDFYLIQNFIR